MKHGLSMDSIETVRNDFPALADYVWFQNGGVSITPRPVAKEHARLMDELLERGPMHIVYPDEENPRRERSMRRIANFFSVEPQQLALMRGVSEAYQTVLRGLDWVAGDEVIISEEEEAALLLPTLHLRDRQGIKVVKMRLEVDPQQQIEAFRACCSERTKLVALSHVTTDLGFRLPVREICQIARSRSILTFLDLAHSAGLYPISLDQLGCDFAGILSYKWMYAPYAAGLLYVQAKQLGALQVTYAGGRSEKTLDFVHDRYELRETAERFQYGPWSWPLVHAWAASLDYLEQVGLTAIWDRTLELTRRLKQGIQSLPGATLLTPAEPADSAALVSMSLDGWSGDELAAVLRKRWKLIVKPLPHVHEGLRISVCFFTLEKEIDLLLGALQTLGAERA